MERFCQGDTTAFDTLYARHAPALLGYLSRLAGQRSLAEDLLQTTFLSIVRARDRFDRGARFVPWMYAIATNATRDAFKRGSRVNERPSPDDELDVPTEAHQADPAIARRVQSALAELPLAQREAVVLHRVYGWTFEEMAESLGANASTVRVRAHRGEARLRELLGDIAGDAQ